MAQHQTKPVLDTVDPVWARVRREAGEDADTARLIRLGLKELAKEMTR